MSKKKQWIDIAFTALTVLLIAALAGYIYWVVLTDSASDRPVADIAAEIDSSFDGMVKGDENTLKRLYGVTGQECGEYILYSAESMMDVRELLVVKAKDNAALDTLEKAVAKRLETQKKNFNGYGVEQTALLDAAVTSERGNYFFFAVHKNADLWQDRFLTAIR